MKTKAVRFASALALFAFGAPLSAYGQFIYPPVFAVPPPAENYYAAPKPSPTPPPGKPKAADTPAQAKPTGHYEGRTFVPD
jgi:hypothetical protein